MRELVAEDVAGVFPGGAVLGEDCVAELGLSMFYFQYFSNWEEAGRGQTNQEGTAALRGYVSMTPDNSGEL